MQPQEDDTNDTPIPSLGGGGHGFCLCHSRSNSDTINNDNARGELDNNHHLIIILKVPDGNDNNHYGIIIEILKQLIGNGEGL